MATAGNDHVHGVLRAADIEDLLARWIVRRILTLEYPKARHQTRASWPEARSSVAT